MSNALTIIYDHLKRDPSAYTQPEAEELHELGADQCDIAYIAMLLEDEFGMVIPCGAIEKLGGCCTVADLCALVGEVV